MFLKYFKITGDLGEKDMAANVWLEKRTIWRVFDQCCRKKFLFTSGATIFFLFFCVPHYFRHLMDRTTTIAENKGLSCAVPFCSISTTELRSVWYGTFNSAYTALRLVDDEASAQDRSTLGIRIHSLQLRWVWGSVQLRGRFSRWHQKWNVGAP